MDDEVEVEKKMFLSYTYHNSSGIGEIIETSSEIGVHVVDEGMTTDERMFPFGVSHPYYLDCKTIDILGGCNIHSKPHETLVDYIRSLRNLSITSVAIFTWENNMGQLVPYRYVIPQFRQIIRGMIEFLLYLQENHKRSMRYLDAGNFVKHNDKVKYWSIYFIAGSNASYDNDWQLLANVIRMSVFGDYTDAEIPEDMKNLISLMNQSGSHAKGLRLLNHLSILQPIQRLNFYKSCHEKASYFRFQKTGKKYRSGVHKMNVPSDWYTKVTQNSNLYKPVVRCLSKRTGYKATNRDLIRCVRNLSTHLAENFGKVTRVQKITKTFNELDVELMISSMFVNELLSFQQQMSMYNILENFNI